jgi:acetylornithine deacetylase/succinyl-diaminopimelate desuccinylase-like protein
MAKTMPQLDRVLSACQEREQRDLADLFRLIAQPSISAQNVGVRECADLFVALLQEVGFTARLMPTPAHPVIFAEWLGAPGRPTVLIYGHYDVQPPDPLDEWLSPPFEPTIRDGKLFGRGAGDNKGQIFAQIAAARTWLEVAGALPVNVKLVIEGEEETGSPHLQSFVRQHRDLLTADLVYTSDGPVHDDAYPQVVYGVRGLLYVELRARGASHDLHSGNWGGIAPNAAWDLVRLLGTMRDADGRVTIPGFYDDVRQPTPAVEAAMANFPLDQRAALATVGLDRLPPPHELGYFDRLMTTPTLNIAGFTSGYGGPGAKTVIPATATVKMDMRLVPDQRTDDIFAKFETHVARLAPDVEVLRLGSMEPSYTPLEHPYASIVRQAVTTGFGVSPIDVPLLGGSLPDAVFTQTLGLPSFLVPYANADERNHAPNENIQVSRFFAGIRTAAALFAHLAEAGRIEGRTDDQISETYRSARGLPACKNLLFAAISSADGRRRFPNTATNMKLLPLACGEKYAVTSSSYDVEPTAPSPSACAASCNLAPNRAASS